MQTNKPITIGKLPKGVTVFHAGTSYKGDMLLNTGGRVLGVNAVAATLEEAAALAYKGVEAIDFEGMIYRKDIAYRCALTPQSQQRKHVTVRAERSKRARPPVNRLNRLPLAKA